jgi:hypothetical protein
MHSTNSFNQNGIKIMKQINTLHLLAAIAVCLVGCSSTPTKVDTGPIQARSFRFFDRKQPYPGYVDKREDIHALIQQAIIKRLAAKGIEHVKTGGDVTVGYLLIIREDVATTSINSYFGWGSAGPELQEKANEAYAKNKDPKYFHAGTLLIDIADPKTNKLLKRGHATRPILQNVPEDVRAARIQEVVDEILLDLRLAP